MNATEALDNNSTMNLEKTSTDLYLFILPIIVIFGLCGNVISLVTIFYSRLREVSMLDFMEFFSFIYFAFIFFYLLIFSSEEQRVP